MITYQTASASTRSSLRIRRVATHPAWIALASALTGVGGTSLVIFAVESRKRPAIPGSWFVLAWVAVITGLVIFLFLLAPPTRRPFSQSAERYEQWRRARLVSKARYYQRLRCLANGHKWTEAVVETSTGWLPHEGAIRRCPVCGDTGATGGPIIPSNTAARKLQRLNRRP
jgi:hypothetical protein